MSSENGSAGSDTTLELPMLELPASHACHDCGQCCHYVATEIDNPSTFNDYENIHWYLIHRDISVYIDWEGDWYIEFKTECEYLSDEKSCGIYTERPKICSEFSWDECEISTDERAWKYYFNTFGELLEWLQERRPKGYEKYMKARAKLLRKRAASAAGAGAAAEVGTAGAGDAEGEAGAAAGGAPADASPRSGVEA